MRLQKFGSMVIAQDLLEDGYGTLSRAWESGGEGIVSPVFLRRFGPALAGSAFLRTLDEAGGSVNLPPACGRGHAFSLWPEPHWKLDYRPSRSIRSLSEACKREGYPFGLPQGLHLAWQLLQVCGPFWRRRKSIGALTFDSVRVDFEGSLFLPDLGWMPTLVQAAAKDPALRAAFPGLPEVLDGDLETEAKRLARFLIELFRFESLPPEMPDSEVLAHAHLWTPAGPEPLPGPVTLRLSRMLGSHPPFRTLEEGLEDLQQFVFELEEGPSTFNLAYLMHTLFRREFEQQAARVEEEVRSIQGSLAVGESRPDPAEPLASRRPRSTKMIWAAAGLLCAGGGFIGYRQYRSQEVRRMDLEAELARAQGIRARQAQASADLAALEWSQAKVKAELEQMMARAREVEEQEKIRAVRAGGQARPAPPTAPLQAETRVAAFQAAPPAAPPPVPALQAAPALQDGPAALRSLPGRVPVAERLPQAVRLRVFVAEDGHPIRAVALPGSSVPPELVQRAVDAALGGTYTPAVRAGRAVREWTEVVIGKQPL